MTDQARTTGRCGDTLTTGTITFAPRTVCALPFGHQGWHRADNGAEWSRDPASTASAYLVISDRVMGWVDVDRDRADEYARNVGGVLVQVPVIADYRPDEQPHHLAHQTPHGVYDPNCPVCTEATR